MGAGGGNGGQGGRGQMQLGKCKQLAFFKTDMRRQALRPGKQRSGQLGIAARFQGREAFEAGAEGGMLLQGAAHQLAASGLLQGGKKPRLLEAEVGQDFAGKQGVRRLRQLPPKRDGGMGRDAPKAHGQSQAGLVIGRQAG